MTLYGIALAVSVGLSGLLLAAQVKSELVEPHDLTAALAAPGGPSNKKGHSSKNSKKKLSESPTTSTSTPHERAVSFVSFRRRYIIGYTMMVMADWMQGPYLLAMYHSFGYTARDVGVLYLTDYSAAAVLGLAAGVLADIADAKSMCILYAVVYAFACACNHFSDTFAIMLTGVALDGLCNALLRTGFENYASQVSVAKGYPEPWKSHLLAVGMWVATCSSIVAGLVCYWIVEAAANISGSEAGYSHGFLATMDAAAILLLGAAWYVQKQWPSVGTSANGSKEQPIALFKPLRLVAEMGVLLRTAASALWRLPQLRYQALLELCFEATLLSFIAIFPETIYTVDPHAPHGLSFSALVSCIVIGCSLFNWLNSTFAESGANHEGKAVRMALGGLACVCSVGAFLLSHCANAPATSISGIGGVCDLLSMPEYSPSAPHAPLALICLSLMEVAFGFYYPALAVIHDSHHHLCGDGEGATEQLESVRNSLVGIIRFASYVVAGGTMLLLIFVGLEAAWTFVAGLLLVATCVSFVA